MKKKFVVLAAAASILFGATAMTSTAVLADDTPPWTIGPGTGSGTTDGSTNGDGTTDGTGTGTDTGSGDLQPVEGTL